MQNIDEQMLHDLFEESNSELDALFFGEHETYAVPTTLDMNEEDDERSVHSSSTQNSDCGEEFDLNPIPCNGSSEQELIDYLSNEALNIFHQAEHPRRAVSPNSDSSESPVTPKGTMAKLAECMERSALSRSLVKTFCQFSFLKHSASQEMIQVCTSSMAMNKSRERIKTKMISVVKASASRSAKTQKMGSCLRNKSKNQKPSDSPVSSVSKKNDDFRASGLKVSTKALIAKFKFLERGNQDDGNHRIASFLRREKLNSLLQLSPQVA
jgi:hypothetical protein